MRADMHLGQRVGGQADILKVTAASLVDEAAGWGIRRRAASAVVTETLDQVLAAIPATPGDPREGKAEDPAPALMARGEITLAAHSARRRRTPPTAGEGP